MIEVKDKSRCCGCGACAQRCPVSCIAMREDEDGFLYPQVDADACVDCHLCEQVCPCLNEGVTSDAVHAFAAVNPDVDERMASSSGGVFSVLARDVIARGGVVFGARFDDDWNVVHDCADTLEGLAQFRGSKYVQSLIGDSYSKAQSLLKQGKPILFTGTPCQIHGLKRFLGKDYENLIAVEVACHGVPSPKVWRSYLRRASRGCRPAHVSFRDKSTGWKGYSVLIGDRRRHHDDDNYMIAYLNNYNMCPSCVDCPSKEWRSGADIMLADLWGADKILQQHDDDKGISALIVRTERGQSLIHRCGIAGQPIALDKVVLYNPAVSTNAVRPTDYDRFWQGMRQHPAWTLKRYRFLGARNRSRVMSQVKVYLHHRLDRLLRGTKS